MKILFIVPYAPSLIRVRPYQLIRGLAGKGHEVTLATLWTTEEEKSDLHTISAYCEKLVAHHLSQTRAIYNSMCALLRPWPLQSVYCWQPALAENIAALLYSRPFDVVHLEHLRGARYGLEAKTTLARQQKDTPVIWDSVDCITHLFQQAMRHSRSLKGRIMTGLDLSRTRRYEGWLTGQFDRVLVTSSTDKDALAALAQDNGVPAPEPQTKNGRIAVTDVAPVSEQRLEVVANGVDLDYFSSQPGVQEEATLVFTGKMSYHANITAALYLVKEIMPRVWAQQPHIKVWIVGKEPSPEVCALASSSSNGSSSDGPNGTGQRVLVTGTVPDIRPYLHRATLAVAPILYGAGIQNKLLEAMACAAPVIATPQAVAGLHALPIEGVRVADGADAFAQAILQLLHDSATRTALGRQGRCYVEKHYAWPNVAKKLTDIYQEAIAAKQGQFYAG